MNSNFSVTDGRGRSTPRLFSGSRSPSSVPGFPVRARAAAPAHSRSAAALRRHAHGGKRPPSYRGYPRLYRAPSPLWRSGATSRSPSSRLHPGIQERSSSSVEAITYLSRRPHYIGALSGSLGAAQKDFAGRQLAPLRELIDDRLLDALLERSRDEAGGLRLTGEGSMLGELVKAVLERALEAELTAHLGYARHDPSGHNSGNSRNGTISKKVQTGIGPVGIEVPRDRAGMFEPVLVPKRSGRVSGGLDDMVISLYAHGMSVRDILHHLKQVYGTELSAETVSRITDAVLEEVKAWQSRPLDPVYAVVFPAAIGAGSATTTSCRPSPPTWRPALTLTGKNTCWASGWPRPRSRPPPLVRARGSGPASWPACATAASPASSSPAATACRGSRTPSAPRSRTRWCKHAW